MSNVLVTHAIQNVWCSPNQDSQYIIRPARISPTRGVINQINLMMSWIDLPTRNTLYHVFQIGQLHPLILNLIYEENNYFLGSWRSLSTAMNSRGLMVDIYTHDGVEIPRHEVFYFFNYRRDLVLAVKQNAKIPIEYGFDDIYFRVYENAFFASLAGATLPTKLYTEGVSNASGNDIIRMQTLLTTYGAQPGGTRVWVNGLWVDNLTALTVNPGDTVDFIYDGSIDKIIEYSFSELPTFTSVLDNTHKYLLHYTGTNTSIDFFDDTDLYLVYRDSNVTHGVYVHRNQFMSCRMLTHRDYSIPVEPLSYLKDILMARLGLSAIDPTKLFLRLWVRHSGYNRPLVLERSRINELYKLSSDDLLSAMVGTVSGPSFWRAEQFETSGYAALMRASYEEITVDLVKSTYGYNACSKVLADTPLPTVLVSGVLQAALMPGCYDLSSVYEYDSNGLLLGHYPHTTGSVYTVVNSGAQYVEALVGRGTHQPQVSLGQNTLPVPSDWDYRVYETTLNEGVPSNTWTDITDSGEYTVSNGVLTYVGTNPNAYLMVREDSTFLAYDLHIQPTFGVLSLTLTEMETRFGVLGEYPVPVPGRQLDIFLNGRGLIEEIDYIVVFPKIVITNKEYLTINPNTTDQWIHVRFRGLCKTDLTYEKPKDYGFVKYGFLSSNQYYNLRDDKVLRIVLDGCMKRREDLQFAEASPPLEIINSLNGRPYSVSDILVPMRGFINQDTYSYRDDAESIDVIVGGYLTMKLPEQNEPIPTSIPARYQVYSPFIANLLLRLALDIITDVTVTALVNDSQIIAFCQPYEVWLPFDPIQPDQYFDSEFMIVHPHNDVNTITLSVAKYSFLMKVVRLYGNGRISLSPFITTP